MDDRQWGLVGVWRTEGAAVVVGNTVVVVDHIGAAAAAVVVVASFANIAVDTDLIRLFALVASVVAALAVRRMADSFAASAVVP